MFVGYLVITADDISTTFGPNNAWAALIALGCMQRSKINLDKKDSRKFFFKKHFSDAKFQTF